MASIQSYLPIDRRLSIATGKPLADRHQGAVVFADISGFTSLTAALYSELGSRAGAETLITQLNRVYTALVAEINSFGGNAINFSGDSMTCWFDDPDGVDDTASPASAALRAVACGLELQRVMNSLGAATTPGGTIIPLGLKVSVAAGSSRRFLVGNPDSYVLEVLAGSLLDEVATAEEFALRGEVIVTRDLAGRLAPLADLTPRMVGGHPCAVVRGLTAEVPRAPCPEAPPLPNDAVRPWLLPPVYEHLQQETDAFLAELRTSVALFVRFNGIDYDTDDEAGAKLNDYVCRVQEVLDRYEGYLLQITMGDKGGYLHASFGAPTAHENDAERAAAAALEIAALTSTVGYLDPPQIGISQGLVHSGAYGSPDRSTYGVIGNEVNVSARLMSAAEPLQILVSERAAATIEDTFDLLSHAAVTLKGLSKPLPVRVLAQRRQAGAYAQPDLPEQQMIGRTAERAVLADLLTGLARGEPGLLIVEGEAGVGKSTLIHELVRMAGEIGEAAAPGSKPAVLVGHGDPVELSTPYYAWRPVFEQLFGLDNHSHNGSSANGLEARVVEMIDPDLRYLAPLLNIVLPLGMVETPLTEQITGEARQDNTHLLLANILRTAAALNPLILILDDAHWLDSVSWTLARRIQRDIPHMLLVLVARPMGPQTQTAVAQLTDGWQGPFGANGSPLAEFGRLPAARHIGLDALPASDIEALICARFGVSELPPAVSKLIQNKAEGNPFFSEELAYALRDAGWIEIVDGRCRLTTQASDLDRLDFPNSIEGVITSRIDLLSPTEQLTVKVASVIGRSFAYRILADVYPVVQEIDGLQRNLEHLNLLDITMLESPEPNLAYFFKHILTQEVAYGLMTSGQQRGLHRVTAEWFEKSGEDLERSYPLIGYHYERAGNRAKAVSYYSRAGENAFRDFANKEAIRFLSLSLELAAEDTPALQRAHWHTLIGEASYRLTLMEQSEQHYLAALALLGQPAPGSQAGRGLGLARELARQTAHRHWPGGYKVHVSAEKGAALLEAARASEGISELYYNSGDQLASFYHVMTTLNLAERAGPSPELIRSYANMAATFAIVSRYSLAESYRARALAMAAEVDDLAATAAIQVPFSVYSLWIGAWDRAEAEVAVALDIYSRLGEWRRWGVAAWVLPQVVHCRGEFIRERELWADLHATALRGEDTRHQIRSRGGQFYYYLSLGQWPEALTAADQVDDLLARYPEMSEVEERMWLGLHAQRALHKGDLEGARDLVQQQLAAIDRASVKFDLLGVFATPAEVLLALWEQGVVSQQEVEPGFKVLRRYARMYPFARAQANRIDGRFAWLAGNPDAAEKLWRKSIAQAEELGMPVERELTLQEMAARLGAVSGVA